MLLETQRASALVLSGLSGSNAWLSWHLHPPCFDGFDGFRVLLFLGILSLLSPLVSATTNSNAVSIFNLPLQSNTANYTFALTIPGGSTDLYFHLAGPTAYSWIAVGTGSEMADSMMIVMYSNTDGTS